MDEYAENLEQCIRRSNEIVKSVKHKMQIVETHLRLKEKIHIHGLFTFMGRYPEVSDKEIYQTIKGHPLKFWLLKDLCKENPELIDNLRSHGFVFACGNLDRKRGLEEDKQSKNAQL